MKKRLSVLRNALTHEPQDKLAAIQIKFESKHKTILSR